MIDPNRRRYRVTLRLPHSMLDELHCTMEERGYTQRRRSLWVEQALLEMADHDPDLSESTIGDRTNGSHRKLLTVHLTKFGHQQLTDSIIDLRQQAPTIEGVRSLVIRSAIRFRIRHPEYFADQSPTV